LKRRWLAPRRRNALRIWTKTASGIPAPADDEEVLAVNEVLDRCAKVDAQKTELVKLRYFVGLTIEEAAAVLSLSEPTAKRWWAYAKAWLAVEIKAAPQ
jgi:DNA-directed RNA polymerase specialized sigma24 family protein